MNYPIKVQKELLDLLEGSFPNTLPLNETSESQLSYLQGQQAVINYLKVIYDDINQTREI